MTAYEVAASKGLNKVKRGHRNEDIQSQVRYYPTNSRETRVLLLHKIWKVDPVSTGSPLPHTITPTVLYSSLPVLKLEKINAHFESTL